MEAGRGARAPEEIVWVWDSGDMKKPGVMPG
jgi:hypothetical protein